MLEGSRPLLIEVQALVTPTAYGMPQRSCTGFDQRRLNMLLAVLEKRMGFRLGQMDVFLNMAGGIKVEDPSLDLAVCAAIASSVRDTPLPDLSVFCGEVGLSGEIRPVHRLEQRISEADRLGFKKFYGGPGNDGKSSQQKIKMIQKSRLFEVLQEIL
jgi:DNA repair protein RadA/Sms